MTSAPRAFRSGQQGVTLIVALIFLAILTLLGITVARTTSLEERMAGNTRDRDIAFQAAEAALRDAAEQLETNYLDDPFDCVAPAPGEETCVCVTPGLVNVETCGSHANSQAYWSGYDWEDDALESTVAIDAAVGAVPAPRYVIEKRGAGPTYYRITVRGKGTNSNTVVILQAEYEHDAP